MPSWSLEDASIIAAENKYTFFKPSAKTIAKVKPGEHVKLIFKIDPSLKAEASAERMWVFVESIDAEGTFHGYLDNDPVHIKDLKHKDKVTFRDIHIISTAHDQDEADNLVEKYSPRCLVAKRILAGEAKIGVMSRQAPDRPNDSGWAFLVGDETNEHFDNPDYFAWVSLGAVLRMDDSIVNLLDAPIDSEFVRDASKGFVPSMFDEDPPVDRSAMH